MNTDFDDAFEGYMYKVYPKVKTTDNQFRESRRVFIAGLFQMFCWVKGLNNFSDDEALRILTDLEQKFVEYLNKVKRDKD